MPTIKKLYTSSGVAITAPTDLAIEGVSLTSSPNDARNYSIACSVGSNALTIALKSGAGTDCTGLDYASFGFRSATLTSGIYSSVNVTAALSMTVSSGSTLGGRDAQPHYHYIYVINNSGTAELAISSTKYGDGTVVSTTAEGGAGAADSASAIYSTTARSNVALRRIGRILSTQTTAGTWAAAVTEITSSPVIFDVASGSLTASGPNGYGSTNTKIRRFGTTATVGTCITGGDSAANGYSFTINEPGIYNITYYDTSSGAFEMGISLNSSELTTNIGSITFANRLANTTVPTAGYMGFLSLTRAFTTADTLRAHCDGLGGGDVSRAFMRIEQISKL